MRSKFVFLVLVCISVLFFCVYTKSVDAETLDNEKNFMSGAFDLPIQINFDHHAYFSAWFLIAFVFAFIPQTFLIEYLEKHEQSPPRALPVISF